MPDPLIAAAKFQKCLKFDDNEHCTDQNSTRLPQFLKRIEGLMSAKRGTPEGDRLDVLVTLAEKRLQKKRTI